MEEQPLTPDSVQHDGPPRPEEVDAVAGCLHSREWRSELLAEADGGALVELAERCMVTGDTHLTGEPVVGMVPMCVREPVVGERFLLVDVLVTQAEVDHRSERGWAMRLGDDKAATVAAAICDAEAAGGVGLTREIDALCLATAHTMAHREASEWAELLPTEVRFEELD
jgi:alpha-D-ribose 1-methylphosphonate 5-triphosphate synthase subunit PhnG